MINKSFTVKAEFSREDESGWLSFEKAFKSEKEAKEAFGEAIGNPLTISAELVQRQAYRPNK